MNDLQLIARILALGAVTGMRAFLGLALLAWLAPGAAWMATTWVRTVLGIAAAGELLSDKLPRTPSRLKPGPLLARVLIGSLIGGTLAAQAKAPIWLGALLGSLSAATGAFAGNKIRAGLVRKTGLKDLYFALGEDALAIAIALLALAGPLAT